MPAKKTTPVFGSLDRNKTLAENSVNSGPMVLDNNVTIKNPDGTGFQRGYFNISLIDGTSDDHLYIASREGIVLQLNGETGTTDVYYDGSRIGTVTGQGDSGLTVMFDQPASDAAVTALARSVVYSNSDDTPSTTARSLYYSVADAEGTLTVAKMQLKIKAENDAPLFSGLERASTHAYADAIKGFVIDSNMAVSDPDGTGFKGATLNVHVIGASATDQLYLAPGAFTITGTKLYLDGTQVGTVSANGASGSDLAFTFKGRVALSDAQMSALLEQVSYRSTAAEQPSEPRNISFTLTDAQKGVGYGEVSLDFVNASPVFLASSTDGPITRVSTGLPSSHAAVSPDGTKVAYLGSVAGVDQVFVKNLETGTVTLVSSNAAGGAGNGACLDTIAFSPDGHTVAFVSRASDLIPGDTNGVEDVFVKNLDTGVITRVSTDSAGNQANAWSEKPVFSPDGTKIAFESAAFNFGTVDTNGSSDLFVKDLASGAITRVSTTQDGGEFGGGAFNPAFSPDGTKIAFMAPGTETGPNVLGSTAVYVKDLSTGEVTFISYASAHEVRPVFSPDGTKVAFLSDPGDVIPGGAHDSTQLFVKDLGTGEVTLVSSDPTGAAGNGLTTGTFAFSPDGSRIVFSSSSSNLVAGDTDGMENVFIKDLTTGAVTRVAGNMDGASSDPVFTADGAHVVFTSAASGLAAGDTNGATDIFMASLAVPSVTSAVLTEDAARSTLSAIGTLYFADADPLDTHVVIVGPAGNNVGTFSAEVVSDLNGTGAVVWSYSIPEADVAPLAPGESRNETFYVTVSDGFSGSTRTSVTVTVIGAEDGSATPAFATFNFAPQATPSQSQAESPDLWASVAACLAGSGETFADVLALVDTHMDDITGTGFAVKNNGHDRFDIGISDGFLGHTPIPLAELLGDDRSHAAGNSVGAGHDVANGADAIATHIWNTLHGSHPDGHSLV